MAELEPFVQRQRADCRICRKALAGVDARDKRNKSFTIRSVDEMKLPLGLFGACTAAIVAIWWWLGAPADIAYSTAGRADKLQCVSYAPFRADQSPLDPGTRVEVWQIEEDLARLRRLTDCVRTYSTDFGLDQIPAVAERLGLKVLLGVWISRFPEKTRAQIDTGIALAKRYPEVIRAVIVGNEVLLRGELSAVALGEFIREVKAAVPVPVTYADVWEFWERNRDLANAVDFVTIHILPYWEDVPIPAETAAAHVVSIRQQVAESFRGKEIMIGEFGWPSAGRMREGALPSPTNQARVVQQVLASAQRYNFRLNVIEAFDQPWKRRLEGTVGGYWGLLTAETREPKFSFGQPVSDHPYWRWQAAGGVLLAALVFATALAFRCKCGLAGWLGVAADALSGGILAGWTLEMVRIESLGIGGWLRSLAFALLALAAPLVGTAVLARRARVPSFSQMLGRRTERPSDPVLFAAGAVLAVTTVLGVQTALGLVFDPRYRDFPFAPLTAAVVPFAVLALFRGSSDGKRGVAETVAAATLALSTVYVVLNEGFANWQALWCSTAFAALAFTLVRSRAAQSSG